MTSSQALSSSSFGRQTHLLSESCLRYEEYMTKLSGQRQNQGQERHDIPSPPTQKWLTVKDSVVGKVFELFWSDDFFWLKIIPILTSNYVTFG